MALQQGKSWFRHQAAPITIGLLASFIIFAFIWWFSALKGMEQIILGPGWQSKPWTLLTYPWAQMPFSDGLAIVCFVFLIMWVFFTGSYVERELGPAKYIGLWAAMILLPALFQILLGPVISPTRFGAAGVWLPEAGITIAWCTRNPTAKIMMYGIIPLSGKILGAVTVVTTILLAGFGNPVLGVVAALHLPIAWAFAANKIPFWTYTRGAGSFRKRKATDSQFLRKTEKMGAGYYDDVKKREKEREERERLRKLFESSLMDDKDGTGT